MKPDIEIAQAAKVQHIEKIAEKIGLSRDDLEFYGKYKAKVPLDVLKRFDKNKDGKLIFVTAITATKAGEGKTVTSIGLCQGLGQLGKKVMLSLREPSLGPTFGIKGGATGGGYSQVYPMWDIDLHFTGDIHAVGTAHNLLSALVENHITKKNELNIDATRIVLSKVMDMNARELRDIVVGLGGREKGGVPHESRFDITVASEIMAILALSKDMADLRQRLSRVVVAYTRDRKPVTADKLKGIGSMCLLLKDAIMPNLVQTLEGQPALIHGAPFANIAHGNSSIIATKYALKMADYVITEGGFAADLGGEKFFDIVCRVADLKPDVTVLVSSIRALKMHGGMDEKDIGTPNLDYLEKGFANLDKHIENMRKFGVPVVVALNRFPTDSQEELELCKKHCDKMGVRSAHSTVFAEGGKGGVELAKTVLECMEKEKSNFHVLYDEKLPIKKKIEIIAKEIYGAEGVVYTGTAPTDIANIEKARNDKLPICMAKTQLSLTDDPKKKGAPKDWSLTVREVRLSAGAGFIVPLTGELMTIPGLPTVPVAEKINIDDKGYITGLN
ncbi:MAG: formate--tetrahydrofolate ligase [Candidatus Thermoplasmatota archaeon]|nr:formate--tetrahydrofolate ligase [Candidatus Thermoplasmatota archaeon]